MTIKIELKNRIKKYILANQKSILQNEGGRKIMCAFPYTKNKNKINFFPNVQKILKYTMRLKSISILNK